MIRISDRVGRVLGLALTLCSPACATTGTKSQATPAATTTAAAAPTPAATPAAATPAAGTTPAAAAGDAKSLLRASLAEVGKGNLAQARALLDRARPLVRGDRDLEFRAANVAIAV